jgi:deazaflavin-dependent oxidoreductase (nitroreductase family)
MDQVNDWNRQTIEEFRANGGKVGGNFTGAPLLLLHTVGARSGKERVNPMMYQDLGDGRAAVFASKAGEPTHPDWYHNLVANPDVTAEIGTETRRFREVVDSGAKVGCRGTSRAMTPLAEADEGLELGFQFDALPRLGRSRALSHDQICGQFVTGDRAVAILSVQEHSHRQSGHLVQGLTDGREWRREPPTDGQIVKAHDTQLLRYS